MEYPIGIEMTPDYLSYEVSESGSSLLPDHRRCVCRAGCTAWKCSGSSRCMD